MANPKHFAILEKGVGTWNKWRQKRMGPRHVSNLPADDTTVTALERARLGSFSLEFEARLYSEEVDLKRADLGGAKLDHINLCRAELSNSNLRWAALAYANLSFSNLIESDLRSADLGGANLTGASLRGADLRDAHLSHANLRDADLTGANMAGAVMGFSVFANTNLTAVKGLEACRHISPSTIDLHTIAQSAELPLVFLQGCGIPEVLIDYLPSVLNKPLQFYSCFISYSTRDQAFADRLYADLQSQGVRCWFASHNLSGGRKLHDQIDEAIRQYDRLLLILSEHSMNSEWVKTEIAHARQKELVRQRRVLFPIGLASFEKIRDWKYFDGDIGKDSAREIREYFIPDFSKWEDPDCYKKAFQGLVKDLKAETV